jgi:omega-amidase
MRTTLTLSKLALFLVTSSTRVQSTSAYNSKRSLSAFVRNSNNRIKIDSTLVLAKPRKIQTTSRTEQNNNNNNNKNTSMSMSSSASPLPMNESTGNTRVALLQFKVTEDKLQNHATASSYLKKAHEKGASLTVLPEIWNSPYATTAFAEYAEKLPDIDYKYEPQAESECSIMQESPSAKLLFDAATKYNMYIIGGSIPEINLDDGKLYNTCLCISPSGKLIGKHRKVHLFDIDVPGGIRFMESDTLAPGKTLTAFSAGESFGNIGVGICYDIRFPEYAMLLTKKYKCNLIVYPGAFNMTTGPAHWELLQRARAVDNQCFVLTASPARTEEPKEGQEGKYKHYTAWGHSTVTNPWGEVVGTCGSDEGVVVVDLELGDVSKMRQGIPVASQKRDDIYKLVEGK